MPSIHNVYIVMNDLLTGVREQASLNVMFANGIAKIGEPIQTWKPIWKVSGKP